MGLRKFTEYGAALRTDITIRTNDLLFISKSIIKQFDAEQAEYVVLYIDEDSYLAGIEFFKEKPDTDWRKISKEKAGVTINIAPLLRFFGIKKLDKKFIMNIKQEEKKLVFSLKGIRLHAKKDKI